MQTQTKTQTQPHSEAAFAVGDRVRPYNDGEDSSGRRLCWTRLTGTVVAAWTDCGEQRVEVRWDRRAPYPTRLPAYWLASLEAASCDYCTGILPASGAVSWGCTCNVTEEEFAENYRFWCD